MDEKKLSLDELDGVSGGAPLLGSDVAVMRCKTCGARFYGATRADARKKLFEHVEEKKHEGSRGTQRRVL